MNKNPINDPSRRNFLKNSVKGGALFLLHQDMDNGNSDPSGEIILPEKLQSLNNYTRSIDLSPARWIWYPSQRTLPNTVIFFRKNITLHSRVKEARGWILAESRYNLYVNGTRVQFGPAPNDPRFSEVDPVDLTAYLKEGDNVIATEVLFYGHGDGTWPIGKPGFIFKLDITGADNSTTQIISNESWDCRLADCWKPGQYKRWYLRAFQEDFDARKYPAGWNKPGSIPDEKWTKTMPLSNPADLPAICSTYEEYMFEIQGQRDECDLRERNIPLIREHDVKEVGLTEWAVLEWTRSPEAYFQMVTPDSYRVTGKPDIGQPVTDSWNFQAIPGKATLLTFELPEQIVGFPFFTIEAPEGTIIELLVQEGHATGTDTPLMNNHFHSWTRFTCREGINHFQTFDFESLRWLQLHIRNASGSIKVSNVGVRRRMYDWPKLPEITLSDKKVQKVVDAAINTIHNAAQETIVDGMGRERQQYSGDVGHQLHAIFYGFNETRLPARYLNTFSQGLTHDGYFLDCWPAYDRLARLMERQLNLTQWGPILDHSVGFNFDCYHYYLYTADLQALREVYPRLLVFRNYLKKIQDKDTGLLPVEDLGIPSVWIDHDAYERQRHKQCAFNLYAAAMLKYALIPLCEAMEDEPNQQEAKKLAENILRGVILNFWDKNKKMLVINKPWLQDGESPRYCDRSLATAVMYDLIPYDGTRNAIDMLADPPDTLGLSYPANAGWRYWALARGGRMDVVIEEFREKWASLDSVILNNTLQEAWNVQPDSKSQWSHCPVAPLYMMYMGIMGLKPLKPGFEEVQIRPQPADLKEITIEANTIRGPIRFKTEGRKGRRKLSLLLPEGMTGYLLLDNREEPELEKVATLDPTFDHYRLEGGREVNLKLKHT